MPRKKKPPHEVSCAECGATFATARDNARFCPGTDHQRRFLKRFDTRGGRIAVLAMAWVEDKGGGHAGSDPVAGLAMRELTSIVRGWIDEDRAEGRPPCLPYVEKLLAEGLYIDRKRG